MSPREIFSAWFNIIVIILSFTVLWPITFVYGLILGLWAIRHGLFPFKARVSRGHFWNAFGIYVFVGLLVFVFLSAAIDLAGWRPTIGHMILGVVGAGFAFSAVAVAIGRLHDRDMSGWWIVLYLGVPATAIALCFALPLAATSGVLSADSSNSLTGVAALVSCFSTIWALLALGARPGTFGPNRFGPEVPARPPTPSMKQSPGPANNPLG